VEEAKDISSLEKTREFKGRYHVLGGVISPMNGIGPDQLRIKEFINRVIISTILAFIALTLVYNTTFHILKTIAFRTFYFFRHFLYINLA
jgi:recombinational DNA repair protein RecR